MSGTSKGPRGVLRRALRNAGILLSGKASGAVMQLATMALVARGLGVHEFGLFSMLLAQVNLMIGLAAFQTSQATVQYGVRHLAANNVRGFQALVKAGMLLEIGAALAAAAVTVALAPLVGARLGWDARVVGAAQLFALLAVPDAAATYKGLLRLFGRFDLLARQFMSTPAVRLVAVAVAFALDATLTTYVLIWVLTAFVGLGVAVGFALREVRRRGLSDGWDFSLRGLSSSNPGIWRFSMATNLRASITLIPGHLSIFMVGAMLGPASAGLFKVARDLGTALSKPVDMLNQTVYPDIARLVVASEWLRVRRTIVHAGLMATGASGAATLLLLFAGAFVLGAVFGPEYRGAAPVLVLVSLATTIEVLVFTAPSTFYAFGKAMTPLLISLAVNLMFLATMLWRLPRDGLVGAGMAYVVAAVVTVLLSGSLVWRSLEKRRRRDADPPASP